MPDSHGSCFKPCQISSPLVKKAITPERSEDHANRSRTTEARVVNFPAIPVSRAL